MSSDICSLPWLLEYTGDFKAECLEARSGDSDALRRMVNRRLNYTQLSRIAKIKQECPELAKGFERMSIGILSDANSDFLSAPMETSALRHGIWLDVRVESLGNTVAAALNPDSALYSGELDAAILAYTSHGISTSRPGDHEAATDVIESYLSEIDTIQEAISQHSSATLFVQTVPPPIAEPFGSISQRVAGTAGQIIKGLNDRLFKGEYTLIDAAGLASKVGLFAWYDMNYWHWTKQPFANKVMPLYSDYCARHLAALRGKSKKCLVLDLDNTLWGGIIGDDGLNGIELGHGSAKGEAHLAIQKMARGLREMGVVLAVCSKNEESNAKIPFEEHPESALKLDDFAVFQANWNDKASNIQMIAEALTLTPDSFVFLDDNPAEREIVRQELPQVAVPEVPGNDPAQWPGILSAAGYFESLRFTENDVQRAEQYSANAKRATLKSKFRDLSSYYASLEMKMIVTSCSAPHRPRATQLINRSNQYNLTTRRYTEEQLAEKEKASDSLCLAARLEDRFGDNGIICIVICESQGDDWYINSWLLSCRVLSRTVEFALLNFIAAQALKQGAKNLIGHYIPSAKNAMTETHYEKLGFTPMDTKAEGTMWQLPLADFTPFESPIEIVDSLSEE